MSPLDKVTAGTAAEKRVIVTPEMTVGHFVPGLARGILDHEGHVLWRSRSDRVSLRTGCWLVRARPART
jgi:hypothetical protein